MASSDAAPIRLLIAGAGGRMGQAVMRAARLHPRFAITGALEAQDHASQGADIGTLTGEAPTGVVIAHDPLPLVLEASAIIDFTTPASSVALAALAAQARIAHICGTTGMGEGDLDRLRAAARHAPIVCSGNMSLGVTLLSKLVEEAARALGDHFDLEIVEMHHRHKVDAPSGTALLLGEAAARGRDQPLSCLRTPAREGHTGPRKGGSIGFAALRGGTVVGEHSVILAGPSERITLSHSAEDRGVFAEGALAAALWAQGKRPGLYTMRDVLGLSG